MMGIVARSAAVADGREPAPDDVVAQGETAAERFLLRWRGEANPDHVKAIDTYWICTAEHGLNASTFAARVTASTGADCGAALSSAVGALSGPLQRGSRVREADAGGHGDGRPRALGPGEARGWQAHHGLRAPDLPRRGPPSRILKRTAKGSGRHRSRSRSSSRRSRSRRSRRSLPTACWRRTSSITRRSSSTSQRSRRRSRRRCSRARGCGLVGAHPRAEAHRPAVPAVGEVRRPGPSLALRCLIWPQRLPRRPNWPSGARSELAAHRTKWQDEIEGAARSPDFANGRWPTARSGSSAIARSSNCSGAGSRTRALRAAAPRSSRSSCPPDHPGDVNADRSLLHNLAAHDPNAAVRRLAILVLKNGSPHRDTIVMLEGIAEDDEHDKELRETAKRAAAMLTKKSRTR